MLSHLVSQSSHDIGEMVTHGAESDHILRLDTRGMELVGIGILAGLVRAFALSRVMSSLRFGNRLARSGNDYFGASDSRAVASAASVIPAWRAPRVGPIIARRHE